LIVIVISRLSQMCAEQYLQQQFFNPLSMSHSGIDIKRNKYAWESLVPGEMYNGFFHMRSWPWLLQYPTLATHYGASGNIYSTAKDLHLWNKPLHNSSLISAPLYQELIKPALKEYSFGLVIKEKKNKDTYYWHNGSISPLGYSSFLGWLPKQKISIVLLSHRSHNTSLMTEFGIKAANIFVAPSDSEKPIGQLEFSSYISEAVTLFFPLSVILSFRYVYILAFSFIGSASLWTIRLASTLALCACALTLLYPIFRHEKIGVFLFCVTVFALVIILFRNRRKLFDFRFQSITFKSIQSDLISIAIFMYFLQAMVVLWFIVSVIFAGLFVFFYNRIDKTRSQQQII
ncbi:MAG: serine hydrolase, partial [Oligoflexales bacterium]|nr:serine hydrolase [Oligoflexales bacterium]